MFELKLSALKLTLPICAWSQIGMSSWGNLGVVDQVHVFVYACMNARMCLSVWLRVSGWVQLLR